MRPAALALLLFVSQDDPVAVVRKALEKTEAASYSYTVSGRFDRTGEFVPPAILTARIGTLEAARNGGNLVIKWPDGKWKTSAELVGEELDKRDQETIDKLRTLQDGEAPHVRVRELLDLVEKGTKGEDTEVDKTPCSVFTLRFSKERLKLYLERQIETAVARGSLRKPDAIKWSTLEGSLKVFVEKSEGWLAQVVDERSVKIEYKQSASGDQKVFECKFVYDFNGWGKTTAGIPAEVKEKLGMEKK